MLYSLSKRGDAPKIFQVTGAKTGTPWVSVLASSFFGFIAILLTATEQMDIYDVLMAATGTVALYVYLAIAFSQLHMRRKLEAENRAIPLKMWFFPWLTYLVIFFIIISMIVMVFEGSQRTEVIYTSILASVIVVMGIIAQKYQIGTKHIATKTASNLQTEHVKEAEPLKQIVT